MTTPLSLLCRGQLLPCTFPSLLAALLRLAMTLRGACLQSPPACLYAAAVADMPQASGASLRWAVLRAAPLLVLLVCVARSGATYLA